MLVLKHGVGIDVGSTSVKIVEVEGRSIVWAEATPHEGDVLGAVRRILDSRSLPAGIPGMVTGGEGRRLVALPGVIESLCVEQAVRDVDPPVAAVVSLGGENLIVYQVDEEGAVAGSFSGNKCAAGTGAFFEQQLGRMDMTVDDLAGVSADARVLELSSRCSVFMKSDCTHRLNKGEACRDDIVLSLAQVMALKVADFLRKAGISEGRVLLAGGVVRNPHLLPRLRALLPEVELVVPEAAPYLEAYGAALMAHGSGRALPPLSSLASPPEVAFERTRRLDVAAHRVRVIPSVQARPSPGREYVLGVDGGSTTTKACLIDTRTREIAAAHYGRTHGDPVSALKACVVELRRQLEESLGSDDVPISMVATTGSSREILGVFLETTAVYNEIIAHSVGTTWFQPEVDTIFEIGGQDAKYVLLKNGVPIDYAMNEACSAGTGSFLEESASGDLNIQRACEIGEVALQAERPLVFGEHCSAFINSDIRKAIQLGASREEIAAGLVLSIVSNYLKRVVGNRTVGERIVLQGGVARNPAVPLAFAMMLGKPVTVPPDPELMGCFGVGLLALKKLEDGALQRREVVLEKILDTEIRRDKEFSCRACENYCAVQMLGVNGQRYPFGGRCDKYANQRKKRSFEGSEVRDWIEELHTLVFEECAPPPGPLSQPTRSYVVGVPRAFTVHTLWPFFSWFFHTLGVRTELTDKVAREGLARVESGYCFPAEIAHGAVQAALDAGNDFILLPHTRDMESYEEDAPACFCPITQGLPYYIARAFPELSRERVLAPVVSFQYGRERALEPFVELGRRLGFSAAQAERAFDVAVAKQEDLRRRAMAMGRRALAEARESGRPVVAVMGRPYNAYASEANMGIPRKLTSRGHTVVPFDILPLEEERQGFENMYWYYGQQNLRAAALAREEPNLFVTYVSNFSCAPDSFVLHYLKWIMGTKPFLVLELDSHTADAGVDTRIEAFLDIIEGYRAEVPSDEEERYDNGWRFVNPTRAGGGDGSGEDAIVPRVHLHHLPTGERQPLHHNPRVTMLLSNMGRLATELLAAAVRATGINAVALPVPDHGTLQLARRHVSGKECLPSHLVLGSTLQFLASEQYREDQLYLLFVPETTGPCRTGQYAVFFRNLFRDLRIPNVVLFSLGSDSSYTELGPEFTKQVWWGLGIADYMKDIETTLRVCAADPRAAMVRYDELWRGLVRIAERDARQTVPELERIAAELARIPLRRDPATCPRVLVVGEIYVRRDDFAVDQLVRLLADRGIIAKVSGITEWLYYCDFARRYELGKRLRVKPWYRRLVDREALSVVGWHIEQAYKHVSEGLIKGALSRSGLLPEGPHGMSKMVGLAERDFVSAELESEITISSGAAAAAMMEGYSGVVNISPFACLIGRVIEGLLTPWAREHSYPLLSLEIDGNTLPPSTMSKLEIFMLNVLRFRRETGLEELVEREREASVDRVIRQTAVL